MLPMPGTGTMFIAITAYNSYGRGERRCFVSLPWVSALLDEPEIPQRYFVLPPDDEPPPAPEPKAPRRHGPKPRRNGREIIPLDE